MAREIWYVIDLYAHALRASKSSQGAADRAAERLTARTGAAHAVARAVTLYQGAR